MCYEALFRSYRLGCICKLLINLRYHWGNLAIKVITFPLTDTIRNVIKQLTIDNFSIAINQSSMDGQTNTKFEKVRQKPSPTHLTRQQHERFFLVISRLIKKDGSKRQTPSLRLLCCAALHLVGFGAIYRTRTLWANKQIMLLMPITLDANPPSFFSSSLSPDHRHK